MFSLVFTRTVVAPPSSVVKCLWEVFVWSVVLVVCVSVSVSGVLFSVGVCVSRVDLLHAGASGRRERPQWDIQRDTVDLSAAKWLDRYRSIQGFSDRYGTILRIR